MSKLLKFKYTDETLIAALRGKPAEHDRAVQSLCENQTLFKSMAKVLSAMGGRDVDLEDVFMEGLVILVKNVLKGSYKGDSSIGTYFNGICKNIYLKKYGGKIVNLEPDPMKHTKSSIPSPESKIIEHEKSKQIQLLYATLLDLVGEPCKTVLELKKRNVSMKEIAEEFGYENVQSAKNSVNRCRIKMRKIIEKDPIMQRQIQELL